MAGGGQQPANSGAASQAASAPGQTANVGKGGAGQAGQAGFQAPPGGNVFEQSASDMTAARGMARQSAQPMAAFGQFANPYEQQVVDQSLDDLNRARQMTMNDVGVQATGAGAFGGSRLGVAEAETNRAFADQAARTAGQMRMQGYNSAVDNSFRNAGQQLAASGALGGLAQQGFGMGNQINQQQMQQGLMSQGLNQQIIDAGRAEFDRFAAAPQQSLQYPLAAIGGVPSGRTETTEQSPGLFNYLSLGASLL